MKTNRTSLFLALGLALSGTQAGRTAPLPRSQVPADAVWYVHLDLDKLKTTQVGQWLLGELDKPENQQKLAGFQALFNFDPRKKLKDCTLFSRGNSPEDAVLVLRGTFDTDRLTVLARMGKEYRSTSHRDYTIHGWLDEAKKKKEGGSPHNYGAIHTSGAVVLGQKSERVGQALDVMDGLQNGLDKGGQFGESGTVREGAVLAGAARRTAGAQFAPNVEILKHFKTLNLSANEAENHLSIDLGAETESEEAARNLQAMAQGLLAWVSFQGDRTGVSRWLQGLVGGPEGLRGERLPEVAGGGCHPDAQGRRSQEISPPVADPRGWPRGQPNPRAKHDLPRQRRRTRPAKPGGFFGQLRGTGFPA